MVWRIWTRNLLFQCRKHSKLHLLQQTSTNSGILTYVTQLDVMGVIIGNEILLWCEKLVSTPFRCIQRNLGRETVVSIKDSNDWGCFVCHPQQIYEHKARYYSLYRLNKIPGFQTMPYKPKNMIPGKRKSDALFRKAEHIIHSSQHFIDENIGMVAFNKLLAR